MWKQRFDFCHSVRFSKRFLGSSSCFLVGNRWSAAVKLLAPPWPLVIIIGWHRWKDFNSRFHRLATRGRRTRKQSRWNVKIDTGRETPTIAAPRIETHWRDLPRSILLHYNRRIEHRLFDPRRSFDTTSPESYLSARETEPRLILLENCQSR